MIREYSNFFQLLPGHKPCRASGCVVECRICDREVAGSNFGRDYFAPRSTQPSIHPGLVNEYQLQLGRQRQVWIIPIADERWVCFVISPKLVHPILKAIDLLTDRQTDRQTDRRTSTDVVRTTDFDVKFDGLCQVCRHWRQSFPQDAGVATSCFQQQPVQDVLELTIYVCVLTQHNGSL